MPKAFLSMTQATERILPAYLMLHIVLPTTTKDCGQCAMNRFMRARDHYSHFRLGASGKLSGRHKSPAITTREAQRARNDDAGGAGLRRTRATRKAAASRIKARRNRTRTSKPNPAHRRTRRKISTRNAYGRSPHHRDAWAAAVFFNADPPFHLRSKRRQPASEPSTSCRTRNAGYPDSA